MKIRDKWLNELLLEQAGELSRWRRHRLQRRLETDSQLAAARSQLQALQDAVQNATPDPVVSDFCLQQILQAAEDEASAFSPPSSHRSWSWDWHPAVAVAAVAVLLSAAGIWLGGGRENGPVEYVEQMDMRVAEWVPLEWDAIFVEIVWTAHEQLDRLWSDLDWSELDVRQLEEEWARELLEMEQTT